MGGTIQFSLHLFPNFIMGHTQILIGNVYFKKTFGKGL